MQVEKTVPAFLEEELHVPLFPFKQKSRFTVSVTLNQHVWDTHYVAGTVQGNRKIKMTKTWFFSLSGLKARVESRHGLTYNVSVNLASDSTKITA